MLLTALVAACCLFGTFKPRYIREAHEGWWSF
jgi:hypothetical protein